MGELPGVASDDAIIRTGVAHGIIFTVFHILFDVGDLSFLGLVLDEQLVQGLHERGPPNIIHFLHPKILPEFIHQFPQHHAFVTGEQVSETLEQIRPVLAIHRNIFQIHMISIRDVHIIVQNFLFDSNNNPTPQLTPTISKKITSSAPATSQGLPYVHL
jgi:hypothetical protein